VYFYQGGIMEKKIILASNNIGKITEAQEILKDYDVLSQEQVGIHIDVVEDGETFEENAIKKAKAISKLTGRPCIADDSGLCVDFLDGFPGVHTKRFLGEKATDKDRNEDILKRMKEIPHEFRKAHFVCCIALALPTGKHFTFEKSLDGYISTERRGDKGFGFDEIFELENGKTLAEISQKEKLKVSSRRAALEALNQYILRKGL